MNRILSRLFQNDWSGLLLVVVVAIAVIGALKPPFLSSFNIQVLLAAIAINMVIALAQMVIIGIGQMNLAVGAVGGLAAIAFAGMMEVGGVPAPLAAIGGLAIGLIAGLINGYLIAASGISAFVITLATLSLYKGVNLGITEAQPFYGVADSVKSFGNTNVFGPIPWLVVPMAAVALVIALFLNRMRTGRFILAVGGSPHAAELSGISVSRTTIWAHAISGLLAAIAGMMVVSRLQIGQPSIGDDWLILSFAAPVIGGALLQGGHVSVAGTFLGVVIIALTTQALVLFEIDPFIVQIVLGVLILWAVGINRLREMGVARGMQRAGA